MSVDIYLFIYNSYIAFHNKQCNNEHLYTYLSLTINMYFFGT